MTDDDPEIAELMRQLVERPNGDALVVLGDLLQQRGDPRGELIGLQLATTRSDAAALTRRNELIALLGPPWIDPSHWGVGFVRRLDVRAADAVADILAHDSLRLLQELRLHELGTDELDCAILGPPPPAVRRMWVRGQVTGAAALVAALPRLRYLEIETLNWTGELANASVEELVVNTCPVEVLAGARLPAVVQLFVRGHRAPRFPVAEIAAADYFERLERLELAYGMLDQAQLRDLEAGLHRRASLLPVLDLRGTTLPANAEALLTPLVVDLRMPSARVPPEETVWVRVAGRPDWGYGRLVRTEGASSIVEFADERRMVPANAIHTVTMAEYDTWRAGLLRRYRDS